MALKLSLKGRVIQLSRARFIKNVTISRFMNASNSDLVINIIVVRTVVSMNKQYHAFIICDRF
jgi:hypothetical protein